MQAAHDEDEWTRGAAVAALGLIQKKAGVDRMDVRPTIVAALNDASLHVRELGIYAFWVTAEKSPDLSIALLEDGDVPHSPIGRDRLGPCVAVGERGYPGAYCGLKRGIPRPKK